MAYQSRSGFLHAGKRDVSFVRDAFNPVLVADEQDGGSGDKPRMTMAQLRAALRSLILLELVKRGAPDPKGLDEAGCITMPEASDPPPA